MNELREEIGKQERYFMLIMDVELFEGISGDAENPGTGPLGIAELAEAVYSAAQGTDAIAGEAALKVYLKAAWREWAHTSPAGKLYSEMDHRRILRLAKEGSADQRRLPDHPEGVRFAREFLADVSDKTWWERDAEFMVTPSVADAEQADWTLGFLPRLLANFWLSPKGGGHPDVLWDFIRNSAISPVSWDTLQLIYRGLSEGRGEPPHALLLSLIEALAGSHNRPAEGATDPNRPPKLGYLGRNVKAQLCLKMQRRVGVPPNGKEVSGCRIVAEVLGLSEDQVRRIWTTPTWPAVRKVLEIVVKRWHFQATVES